MDRPTETTSRRSTPDGPREPWEAIRRRLMRVRAGVRRALIVRTLGVGLGAGILMLLLGGLLDYWLRPPAPVRAVGLVLALVGAGLWGVRVLGPALAFRPSLSDIALRIERSEVGHQRRLTDLLASGLDLSARDSEALTGDDALGAALRRRVTREAASRLEAVRPAALVRPGPGRRGLGAGVGGLALLAAMVVLAPGAAGTGAARLLMPWSDAAWPRRTLVVDATESGVHEMGVDLVLRARLERTPHEPGETRVEAHVRRLDSGEPARRVLLASRGEASEGGAEVYARQIGTPNPSPEGPGELSYEYWFETEDDRTERGRVRVVAPPELVSAEATIEPPEYASAARVASGTVALGTGADGGGAVPDVLAGSRVSLSLEYSKPARARVRTESGSTAGAGGSSRGDTEQRDPGDALAKRVRDAADDRAPVRVERRERGLEVEASLGSTLALDLELVDSLGLTSRPDREVSLRLGVTPDERPSVAVTEPGYDEAVLAGALIEVAGRAQDDVGLEWLGIESRRARPPGGSPGAPAEAVGEWSSIERVDAGGDGGDARAIEAARELDLTTLELSPGDELRLRARARETYELFGARREPAVSEVRVLRIIEAAALGERIREELESVREQAKRLDERQGDLARRTEREPRSRRVRREQRGVSDQLGSSRRTVEALRERVERNRLDDPALEGLTRDASEALEAGRRASARAQGELESLEDAGEREAEEGAERARERQQRVREELARVVEMLDRGQDGWVMRRSLERLAERQRELRERTRRAGEATLGREMGELSEDQRSELERIADRQRELARESAAMLDELSERARQLREADEAQAAGMRRAAESGRQEAVPEQMRRAAEEVHQNRSTAAGGRQQGAIEAMEQMLEQMERGAGQRDEVLRRVLADAIESLERLIDEQRGALEDLRRARAAGDEPARAMAGLDRAMIELHGDTLALSDEIERGYSELRPVVSMIEGAGEAQSSAIGALRADPPKGEAAEAGEAESLERLEEARAEAERLREEAAARERARQRRELREAYEGFLEAQVALRGEAEPLAGAGELDRRGRRSARTLGEKQATLRERVGELESETEELADASVFSFAHERLDASMERAARRLRRAGEVAAAVGDQSASVRVLQSIVEALRREQNEEDFRQNAGGGGSGGGSGQGEQPLIPPMTELKLLRSMQAEALERTRAIEEGSGEREAAMDEVGRLQERLGRLGRETLERMNRRRGGPGGQMPDQIDGQGGDS